MGLSNIKIYSLFQFNLFNNNMYMSLKTYVYNKIKYNDNLYVVFSMHKPH